MHSRTGRGKLAGRILMLYPKTDIKFYRTRDLPRKYHVKNQAKGLTKAISKYFITLNENSIPIKKSFRWKTNCFFFQIASGFKNIFWRLSVITRKEFVFEISQDESYAFLLLCIIFKYQIDWCRYFSAMPRSAWK